MTVYSTSGIGIDTSSLKKRKHTTGPPVYVWDPEALISDGQASKPLSKQDPPTSTMGDVINTSDFWSRPRQNCFPRRRRRGFLEDSDSAGDYAVCVCFPQKRTANAWTAATPPVSHCPDARCSLGCGHLLTHKGTAIQRHPLPELSRSPLSQHLWLRLDSGLCDRGNAIHSTLVSSPSPTAMSLPTLPLNILLVVLRA